MSDNFKLLVIFLLCVLIASCGVKKDTQKESSTPENTNKQDGYSSVYRYYWGSKDGFKVWIVDGALIRKEIFDEFIYGGNPERYTFVPDSEIWIDNSITSEEFNTTLAHELNERNLMAKFAMTYFDAHDSSLAVELQMRREYQKECERLESKLPKLAPLDFDSTQEITDIPPQIRIKNIYRIPLGVRDSIGIWIVDGYAVRRDIYPDFGFSGNDMAYHFIPPKEIWIDGSVSCEETEYSIALEMKERKLMSQGMNYDDAYTAAVKLSDSLRIEMKKLINEKSPVKLNFPLYRDTGTGKESRK